MFINVTLLDGSKATVNMDRVLYMFETTRGTVLCFECERIKVKESMKTIREMEDDVRKICRE